MKDKALEELLAAARKYGEAQDWSNRTFEHRRRCWRAHIHLGVDGYKQWEEAANVNEQALAQQIAAEAVLLAAAAKWARK